jgi:thiosulfate/3-mercaptopyruvate sulfurtransferase
MTSIPISPSIQAKGYAHPEALVSTEWLAEHLHDPTLRIIESDEDVLLYEMGHLPNAQKVDWHSDLNDAVVRDYVSRDAFQALLRAKGIDDSTTVVFYGDKNNWWACYAFWVFQLFGFGNARLLDDGRTKWELEGREMTTVVPSFRETRYVAPERSDARIRAFMHEVRGHVDAGKPLVDVRSTPRVHRRAHAHARVPAGGAAARRSHPGGTLGALGSRVANADGSFKSAHELRRHL